MPGSLPCRLGTLAAGHSSPAARIPRRMGRMPTFTWTLESQGGNNTGFVVPEDVVLAFGRGRRVPISVTIGDYTYRTT
ncbi:DUF1905 domain-containing protein, partial [Mesorhizobium japonicum]|uniref:DUF1905 domain-containing protein n=1 Tax=Mesorhizobium japonicum TaxID=2066070 RepID=UPI003B595BD3